MPRTLIPHNGHLLGDYLNHLYTENTQSEVHYAFVPLSLDLTLLGYRKSSLSCNFFLNKHGIFDKISKIKALYIEEQ